MELSFLDNRVGSGGSRPARHLTEQMYVDKISMASLSFQALESSLRSVSPDRL